jgi:AcrR family transcriptional regulator
MKPTTKQRILDAALKRFNEDGYVHVRLHQIAEEAEMSVGNMAYHYPHKHLILEAIYEQLRNAQEELLTALNHTPVFETFDYFTRQSFALQRQYRFFYQDTLELMRESEALKASHQEFIQLQELQLEVFLSFNEARGALDWGTNVGPLCRRARQLRRSMDSWMYLQIVEGRDPGNPEAFCRYAWRPIEPFLSPTGKEEFARLAPKGLVVGS